MTQSKRLFGANGIRGVVHRDLTPEFVAKVGEAVQPIDEYKAKISGISGCVEG